MHDIVRMKVFDRTKSLTKELKSFSLANGPMFVLIGKKCAILSKFHNHIDSIIFDNGIPQLDNMRMVNSRM